MRAAWRSARCERRRWPSLLLLLVLAGCANRPDQVAVSVGFDIPQTAMAKDYAALYAPYAMMATAAYADANVLTANNHCPDPQKLAIRQQGDSDQTFGANRLIRAWIADLARRHWECRFGVVHSLKCPARLGPNCDPVAGLEFFIWRRFEGGPLPRCRDCLSRHRSERFWRSSLQFPLARATGSALRRI